MNDGRLPADVMTFLEGACPVVASYGGRDRSLAKAPALLEAALTANAVPHDLKVYPDAGHAFINDHDPAEVPGFMRLMSPLMQQGYRPDEAADARRRIAAFFAVHLGAGAGPAAGPDAGPAPRPHAAGVP